MKKSCFIGTSILAGFARRACVAIPLLLACTDSALADVHYVDVNSTNSTPPFHSWTTAATNIQDAVDAAVAGDEIVVTNGIYASGGRDGSRVNVDKPLNVRSVNGPQFTTIDGGQSLRCVYITNGATLSGFTLTHGYVATINGTAFGGGAYGGHGANQGGILNNCALTYNTARASRNGVASGGGACNCTLNNCTLRGNRAGIPPYNPIDPPLLDYGHAYGGGATYCTLNNCTLSGNTAQGSVVSGIIGGNVISFAYGGGAYASSLNNCTLTGNSANAIGGDLFSGDYHARGGGAYQCGLGYCILIGNSAYDYPIGDGESDYEQCGLNHCWLADPLFVDPADDDFRLQSNSPCINAGNNTYAVGSTDLDGNPRISGGTVDIGAYEFQWPQLTMTSSGVPPSGILLMWPTNAVGFTLQSTTDLGSPAV